MKPMRMNEEIFAVDKDGERVGRVVCRRSWPRDGSPIGIGGGLKFDAFLSDNRVNIGFESLGLAKAWVKLNTKMSQWTKPSAPPALASDLDRLPY